MSGVYVAGHAGLVGSAICRHLRAQGVEPVVAGSEQLDLRDEAAVAKWFGSHSFDQVYLAAARVGGIRANQLRPAEFIRDNLAIQTNVIHHAYDSGVGKLLFLGSSCIYPRLAPQPVSEDSLLTGALESSNESYAIAKIAGIKMCQAYRDQYGFDAVSVMPTNLYGPEDNFDLETSHVLPALIRRFHDARFGDDSTVTLWGTGSPRREFLHVDDLAAACEFLMRHYSSGEIVNVGWGKDLSIAELAKLVSDIVGFRGGIEFDATHADGTPRKLLNTERIRKLGWQPKIELRAGIESTYRWYSQHQAA